MSPGELHPAPAARPLPRGGPPRLLHGVTRRRRRGDVDGAAVKPSEGKVEPRSPRQGPSLGQPGARRLPALPG
jgi:hypothetical protein